MSHENARAFGAIMTALWPLNRGDRDTGLLTLATILTEPSSNDAKTGEDLRAMADYIIKAGTLDAERLVLRIHAWRTACVVVGALPTYLEVRFDLLSQHLREKALP